MSGHSKWATIKRAKGAADAKRGIIFTKLSKNISLAAKNGKDPDMNPSLRTAMDAAKAANMPKDNIEKAILRGAGELPGQRIEEVQYEGYGPGGVAIMMRCATDNTNRTSAFIKTTLNKYGGKLSKPGAVSYLFSRKGIIRLDDVSEETQLKVMDAGAEDILEEEGGLTVYTKPDDLNNIKDKINLEVEYAQVDLVPATTSVIEDQETKEKLEELLEILEDNEDVVDLTHNAKL